MQAEARPRVYDILDSADATKMIGGPLPALSYAMVVPSAEVTVATIPPEC